VAVIGSSSANQLGSETGRGAVSDILSRTSLRFLTENDKLKAGRLNKRGVQGTARDKFRKEFHEAVISAVAENLWRSLLV
jgi:hypothetical protein